MLSRCSLFGGQSLRKCVLKFQPTSSVATSAVANSGDAAKSDKAASAASSHPPEYPPPGPKRDFVNFPRLTMKENSPPVRMGFIPESWFQSFYPITGYTGPYMFLGAVLATAYSKEYIVNDHNMIHCYGFITLLCIIHNKFGDKIKAFYDKLIEEQIEDLDGGQEREKEELRNYIEKLEDRKVMKDAVVELTKARTEIVQMELEVSYRERMEEAFKAIKRKLDCQVELENAERRAAQKNIGDYVLRQVMQSITPDLEKNVLQTCIADLNSLAAKA